MVKVAINGFGRIGRLAFRRIHEVNDTDLEVVAVNDLTAPADLAYLLKYDTAQGRFNGEISSTEDSLIVDGKEIKVYAERDARDLPWGELGIDIVLESTGFYTSKDKSQAHIDAGAKKVLISAPVSDSETKLIVYGVNEGDLTSEDTIISAASCTTNSLAPMVKVLEDNFGIVTGNMRTVHAYTSTQRIQDAPGGRKSRAAAANIIPATTGAAKAVGKVIPAVQKIVDGSAFRVPTITGSISDFFVVLKKKVTAEEVNAAMKAAADESFAYVEDPIVSSDVIGETHSSLFDSTQTKVLEGEDGTQLVEVTAWYDNEYGFTSNMVRLLHHFATLD